LYFNYVNSPLIIWVVSLPFLPAMSFLEHLLLLWSLTTWWAEKNLGDGTPPLDRTWSVAPGVLLLSICVVREGVLECISCTFLKPASDGSTRLKTDFFFGMTVLNFCMPFRQSVLLYHNIMFCLIVESLLNGMLLLQLFFVLIDNKNTLFIPVKIYVFLFL